MTVAGGEFQFDGSAIASDFKFNFGDTYVFDQSDATNDGHTQRCQDLLIIQGDPITTVS